MGEFDLIDRFFRHKAEALGLTRAPHVRLGIGDDCALLAPAAGQQLAVSTDMLLEGRHFLPDISPEALGHKALAVNLSDLAAMGAEPLGFLLALALPPERAADPAWLDGLSNGILRLAGDARCPPLGGDTTAGPLNLCVTVLGQVPTGQALRRDGAKAGDEIWVSGSLGDARLALDALRGRAKMEPQLLVAARNRLERPSARLALGRLLRGVASSAIDVSDGLLGDLGHILKASGVGATVDADAVSVLTLSHASATGAPGSALRQRLQAATLAGGDDYELVFTAPVGARDDVLQAGIESETQVSRIGWIDAQAGLRLRADDGMLEPAAFASFDHFA